MVNSILNEQNKNQEIKEPERSINELLDLNKIYIDWYDGNDDHYI